jgi:HK97 family phage portal protein
MPLIPDALARLRARLAMAWSPLPPQAATKASRVGPLVAYGTLHQPVWSPRDYAAFAREGFMQNAVVYRCVRMISEAAASIPLLLYDGDVELEDHPLLAILARPSHDQTGTDFLQSWFGYLLVSGNAYAEAVAVGGQIRELHALRPDRMQVVPGPDGWPEAYDYTVAGLRVRFAAEPAPGVRPILHTRLFHPLNDHYGMSPIEAAATAIDIHNAASGWNKALLDNSARPSGALVYAAKDGHLTGEQFDRLKAELETGFQGARNAGRPLLLEGGLDWKPLSLSPKDMDFIAAKHAAAREIALALGVPPMLLGIPGDNTFANYQEANRTFWRQAVLPLVNRACAAFSSWLSPAYGEAALRLVPDLDQVEALSPERDSLWARLDKATFLTPNEKRLAAGYPALDGGDALSLKFNPNHDPSNGQFTFGPGGPHAPDGTPVDPAQSRRPLRTVSARGRQYDVTSTEQETELIMSADRARQALDAVAELDPTWRPTPSLSDPVTPEGAIATFRAEAQEAEARLTFLQRGGVPLGFASRQDFETFGRTAWDGLAAAGYPDAEPYLRGSAVTGFSNRQGSPFDQGRTSDYDFAVASPTLIERARQLGLPLRGGGTRTEPIDDPSTFNALGLGDVMMNLRQQSGRDVSIVIFSSRDALVRRGPNRPLP